MENTMNNLLSTALLLCIIAIVGGIINFFIAADPAKIKYHIYSTFPGAAALLIVVAFILYKIWM